MARIRTIKPEFPQSESIGRLSRDARLLFVQLWTLVDDSGRARASSRMLASLLYPYDDDAPKLIEGWLTELEQAVKVRLYQVDGSQYLDIPNWLEHQKIDKPSKSRLPQFAEASRGFAEASATDLGPSTKDLGPSTKDLGPGPKEEPALRAAVYTDSKHELWGEGIPILESLGVKNPRPIIGRWLKEKKDDAQSVLGAIQRARDARVMDAVPWITRALQTGGVGNGSHRTGGLADALRKLEESAQRLERESGIYEGSAPPLRLISNGGSE